MIENESIELEAPKPTVEGAIASIQALAEIRGRSFSGRHPELGKMIKCAICSRRHRSSIKCEQKFKELHIEEDLETGEKEIIYATVPKTRNGIVGAAAFKGKRLKPHPNRRMLQFIELVRELLPNEYTEEDLAKARKKARRKLSQKLGRFGFLPRKSAPQKKEANVQSV